MPRIICILLVVILFGCSPKRQYLYEAHKDSARDEAQRAVAEYQGGNFHGACNIACQHVVLLTGDIHNIRAECIEKTGSCLKVKNEKLEYTIQRYRLAARCGSTKAKKNLQRLGEDLPESEDSIDCTLGVVFKRELKTWQIAVVTVTAPIVLPVVLVAVLLGGAMGGGL